MSVSESARYQLLLLTSLEQGWKQIGTMPQAAVLPSLTEEVAERQAFVS